MSKIESRGKQDRERILNKIIGQALGLGGHVAETFEMLCRAKGIKVTELAERCGVSQSYLSRIVNGEKHHVDPHILTKLAYELDMSLLEKIVSYMKFREMEIGAVV